MRQRYRTLVGADMPSLVEDAHSGKGLGSAFLRHAERARILAHVLDGSEDRLVERLKVVDREIALHSARLSRRPQVIVVNKLDQPSVAAGRSAIERKLRRVVGSEIPIVFVSATEGLETSALLETLFRAFSAADRDHRGEASNDEAGSSKASAPVLRPRQLGGAASAVRSRGAFRITHPRAIRIARGSELGDWTVRLQYHGELTRLGVTRRLEELGVQPGDTVRMGDLEFEWE